MSGIIAVKMSCLFNDCCIECSPSCLEVVDIAEFYFITVTAGRSL